MLTSCTVPKKENSLVQKEEKKVEKKKDKKNKEQDKEEEKKEESIVKKEANVEPEDKPVAEPIVIKNPYDDLIAQYRNGLQTGDWKFLDQAAWCMTTNPETGLHLSYAFYDINQDGIQEMFVQNGTDLYHVFTYQNGEATLVDAKPGIRSTISVGNDRTLITYIFGMMYTSIDFKVLPANGTKVWTESSYFCDRPSDHPENPEYTKTVNGVTTSITEEEFEMAQERSNLNNFKDSFVWSSFE